MKVKVSRRAKALAIDKKTKFAVWKRDGGCCIFCGKPQPWNNANAHVVPRSKGGMGIEQNIVTACCDCHRAFDQSAERHNFMEKAVGHLKKHYPNWEKEQVLYNKYQ